MCIVDALHGDLAPPAKQDLHLSLTYHHLRLSLGLGYDPGSSRKHMTNLELCLSHCTIEYTLYFE
jgi:hypothetical protein